MHHPSHMLYTAQYVSHIGKKNHRSGLSDEEHLQEARKAAAKKILQQRGELENGCMPDSSSVGFTVWTEDTAHRTAEGVRKCLRKVHTSSGSPRVLEAEPNEMWRSAGALSGLQLAPPAVKLVARNSARGNVCVRSPACHRTPHLSLPGQCTSVQAPRHVHLRGAALSRFVGVHQVPQRPQAYAMTETFQQPVDFSLRCKRDNGSYMPRLSSSMLLHQQALWMRACHPCIMSRVPQK